jgi:predicted transcriptional regulator
MNVLSFIHSRQSNIIISIYNNRKDLNCSKLTKKTGCTYSYFMKAKIELEIEGFVTSEIIGRDSHVKLTELGILLAKLILKARENSQTKPLNTRTTKN